MVTAHNQVKMLDFGLSRMRTLRNSKGGTLRWAAPEVLADTLNKKKPATPTDIFSFGRIAFFVVSGKLPSTEGKHLVEMAKNGEVPEMIWPDTAMEWKEECKILCGKCFKLLPEDRIDARELYAELLAWNGNHAAPQLTSSVDTLLQEFRLVTELYTQTSKKTVSV